MLKNLIAVCLLVGFCSAQAAAQSSCCDEPMFGKSVLATSCGSLADAGKDCGLTTSCKTSCSTDCCESPFFVRLGVGHAMFGESGSVFVGGTQVAGASISSEDNTTALFDIGFRLNPNWTAMISSGVPPESTIRGTGALGNQVLGTTFWAPAMLTFQRHLHIGQVFDGPILSNSSVYVGGGLAYTMFYQTKDGLVTDFDVNFAPSAVVQLGFEKRVTDHIGVFADVKKVFLETDATGLVGGTPTTAYVNLNPTVLTFGLSYHF